MVAEETLADGPPPPPRRHAVGLCTDIRIEIEDTMLPIEQVDGVVRDKPVVLRSASGSFGIFSRIPTIP